MWDMSGGENNDNPFHDAVICGMIGGGVAWLLGASFVLPAMLSALLGPLFVRGLPALFPSWELPPGGWQVFTGWAVLVAIVVLLYQAF
ncbi:MAG: hypothetical protein ACLFPA_02615 [Dichotomicrobium sp.]